MKQSSYEAPSRKSPEDPMVPEIGDELAVARALSDLAHQLLECSAQDLEQVVHEPVRVRL
ncbi:dsRBD fold-containing protein [Rhodococcoides fascians]|uniref:dsRBD fold-containing protein n=1 Tax=Rhodococcoides fascians TaxID=1828 RepID=UPI00050CE2B7